MSDRPGTTHARVMNMVARGKLKTINDAEGMQFADLSLLHNEAKVRVERFQQYGFSAVAPNNSEAVVLFVGGGRDHGLVMSLEDRGSRLRGQAEGEVALYSNEGDFVVLKRGNTIEIQTDHLVIKADIDITIEAQQKITLQAPQVIIEGDLQVTGNITTGGGNIVSTGNMNVNGEIRANAMYAPAGSVPGPKND